MTITYPYAVPDDSLDGVNSATDTSAKEIIAAQGPGRRIYVTTIVIDNTSAVDTHVDILSGTHQKMRIPAPRGTGATVTLPQPLRLEENAALQFQATTGVTTLTVSAVGFKGGK